MSPCNLSGHRAAATSARNWLYWRTSTASSATAVAFAAALLIGQFVRNEFTYDHWIPGVERVYKITDVLTQPGQPPDASDITQTAIAGQLKVVFPGVASIARVMPAGPMLRHRPADAPVVDQAFAWADPDVFKVLPLPALAGDLSTALQQPDTVVLTHSAARHYFGRDLPIGDTLEVAVPPPGLPGQTTPPVPVRHPMRVTAVLKDLPSNTNLTTEIFASARSAYSDLNQWDIAPPRLGNIATYTFVRLKPGATAGQLQRALDVAGRPEDKLFSSFSNGARYAFHAVALSEAHLTSLGLTARGAKPTGSRAVAYALAGVGALIVLVAAINFRHPPDRPGGPARGRGRHPQGDRRPARRPDGPVHPRRGPDPKSALAAVIAVGTGGRAARPVQRLHPTRGSSCRLHPRSPAAAGNPGAPPCWSGCWRRSIPPWCCRISGPALVLKGGVVQGTGSVLARQALVVIQFAILIGLIVTTITIYRQTEYALARSMGGEASSKIITITAPCDNAFLGRESAQAAGRGRVGLLLLVQPALNTPNTKNIVDHRLQIGLKQVSFDLACRGLRLLRTLRRQAPGWPAGLFSPRLIGEDGVFGDLKVMADLEEHGDAVGDHQ